MVYVILDKIKEGAPRRGENKTITQKVSIVGSLQKKDGTEIMKLTDTVDVPIDENTSYKETDGVIDAFALQYTNEKYSD